MLAIIGVVLLLCNAVAIVASLKLAMYNGDPTFCYIEHPCTCICS